MNASQKSDRVKLLLSYFLKFSFGFLGYWGLAHLGLQFASLNKAASPVWPATGFAIGFLVLFGRNLWPAIFAGAFVANFGAGLPWWVALCVAAGNSLEGYVGAWSYLQLKETKGEWRRYREVVAFFGASIFSVNFSAIIGVLSLCFFEIISWNAFPLTFATWWSGDLLGALLLFPLMVLFPVKNNWNKTLKKLLKLSSVTGIGCILYFVREDLSTLLFVLYLAIFFSVVQLGLWGGIWSSFLIMISGVAAGVLRTGPMVIGHQNSNYLSHQLFVLILILCSFAFNDFIKAKLSKRFTLILVFGFTVSAAIYSLFHHQNKMTFEKELRSISSNLGVDFKRRFIRLEVALRSGVAYWNSSQAVEPEEWKKFYDAQRMDSVLPGLRGYGIILKRDLSHDSSFEKRIRQLGITNLNVKRVTEKIAPKENLIAEANDQYVITYVEPQNRNLPAIGLDVGSERNRRMAALYAAATSKMQITDTIVLIQDNQNRSGFLAFVPIYKEGFDESRVEERLENLVGWAYSPVVYQEFFNHLFEEKAYQDVDFAVALSDDETRGFEIQSPGFEKNATHLELKTLQSLYGKSFNIYIRPKPSFESNGFESEKWAFFFCSLFVLILGYLFSNLMETSKRSEERASEMTKDLRQSEMRFKTLAEGSPLGIFQINDSGELLYVNKKVTEIYGLSFEDLKNGKWKTVIHSDDLAEAAKIREDAMAHKASYQTQYRILRPNGEIRHVRILAQRSGLEDENGGYIGSVVDRTDFERAELQINQQRLAVAASSKMASLGEMAGGIAHEINNPLAIIRGRASILKMKIASDKIDLEHFHKDLTLIENTAERISKIIRGLRNFSRNAEGDPFEETPIKQIIEDSLELCRERLKNNSVDLRIGAWPKAKVKCRAAQISQVLVNLISNAYDAISEMKTEEKWIALSFEEVGSKLRIRVSDCGRGIPQEVVSKMMQPFFTTKGVGKGTGLGLSISVGIMQEHKGQLRYELFEGHTSFVLELPLLAAESEGQEAA